MTEQATATAVAPRIALTTYREQAQWGVWDQPTDLLPANYADAVTAAGGVPMLLPPVSPALASRALDGIDGLVVAGGADVDPGRYGAARHPQTGPPRADRDAWELAVVRAALDIDLPLLGVCRGMQILNVALGGTLTQHLPEIVGTEVHSPSPGVFATHDVRLSPGCRLAGIVGPTATIATHHHQAVDELGAGLVACGWADDGVIEAVELTDRRWALGVQWHPEAQPGAAPGGEPLWSAFVDACAGALR